MRGFEFFSRFSPSGHSEFKSPVAVKQNFSCREFLKSEEESEEKNPSSRAIFGGINGEWSELIGRKIFNRQLAARIQI